MNMSKMLLIVIGVLMLSEVSQGATLYADTNGDGVTDTITSGQSTSGAYFVKIYHPNNGTTTNYNFAAGLTYFEVVGTTDTAGIAGQEVIVRADASGGGPSIYVIEDRNVTRRQYNFSASGITAFGIVSISSNTDGRPGNEIIVYLSNSSYPSIRIIDDARRITRQYDFGIGLVYFEITRITDTNGTGGVEIITRQDVNASTRAIRIIDDTSQSYRQYSTNGQNFSILGIRNYDAVVGDEICYYVTSAYRMIVDRNGTTVSRSNCN
jgi:hypothetical protein